LNDKTTNGTEETRGKQTDTVAWRSAKVKSKYSRTLVCGVFLVMRDIRVVSTECHIDDMTVQRIFNTQ